MKYIKYDCWISSQQDFDFCNHINGEPSSEWNGTIGPYHQIINQMTQERLENIPKKKMNDKQKCSGIRCIMNRNFKVEDCKLFDQCEDYTPGFSVADMSGMNAIIDMAIKQFSIDEADKEKIRILFNAYVAEYMRVFCRL